MPSARDCQQEPGRVSLAAFLISLTILLLPFDSAALSEVGPVRDSRAQDQDAIDNESSPHLPLPDPLINRSPDEPTESSDGADETGAPAAPVDAEIILESSALPEPVRRMRELIVEAAASGDIEKLRTLTNPGPRQTQVNGEISDPIEAMKSYSGDPDGLEILAILLDILSTGAARIDAGTPEEVYVWPYFAGKSLATLTPPERVELLRIVTAGDLIGMEDAGNYNFYRLAITPDGEWKSFTGGD